MFAIWTNYSFVKNFYIFERKQKYGSDHDNVNQNQKDIV